MVAGAGAAAKGGVVNNNAVVMVGNDKFCGRILGTQAAAASQSICSKFILSFYQYCNLKYG